MEDMESVGDTGIVMESGGLRDLNVTSRVLGANQQEEVLSKSGMWADRKYVESRLTGRSYIVPFQLGRTGHFDLDNLNGREITAILRAHTERTGTLFRVFAGCS
jgi:hypothetical protein